MKRITAFVLSFLLVFFLIPNVFAENDLPHIVDNAGLLTDQQISELEDLADQISHATDMDIVILTVDSLGSKSSEEFADDYYDDNHYGIGSDNSGILLLLSMEDRDWAISTCGDAIYAVTDYGIEQIFSAIAPYLSKDQYYSAFLEFLDQVLDYYDAYLRGEPIDGYVSEYTGPGSFEIGTQETVVHAPEKTESFGHKFIRCFGIALVIGLIVSGINLLFQRSAMNTLRKQSGAQDYIVPGSFQPKNFRDIFLYSQQSRTRIESNSSSGGGSSVHHSSSGSSHGGGHGKF